MKQGKIAKQYGISAPLLNAILNGKIKVRTISTASKLSRILDMPIESIASSDPARLKARFYELHEFGADA